MATSSASKRRKPTLVAGGSGEPPSPPLLGTAPRGLFAPPPDAAKEEALRERSAPAWLATHFRGLDPAATDACRAGVLEVRRSKATGRSCATRLFHRYPLRLVTPKRVTAGGPPGADCVWCYQIGFGGGLVAGDRAGVCVDVGDACAAALATQGTQKVYKHARRRDDEEEDEEDDDEEEDDTEGVLNDDLKVAEPAGGSSAYSASGGSPSPAVSAYSASRSKTSRETVSGLAARVGVGGLLAVLPDPTQAFRDARFRQAQRVDLAPGASLALVDWTVAGRAAFEGGGAGGFTSGRGGGLAPSDDPTLRVDGGERWRFASFATRTEVTARGGEVDVLVESSRLERRDPWPGGAGEEALRLRMGDAHALATAVLVGPRTAAARARAREVAAPLVAATVRGGARGTRGGGSGGRGGGGGGEGAEKATAPPPKRKAPPWMFVSASEVPAPDGEDERLDALVVRVAAPSADGCYALLREMLAPLEAELGAPPYAERGLS